MLGKKLITGAIVSSFMLLATAPTFAAENSATEVSIANVQKESRSFSYQYNGINISSPEKLDQQLLGQIYNQVISTSPVQKSLAPNSPNYVIPNDGGGQIIDGPYYKRYSNEDINLAVDLIGGWFISKIPGLGQSFVGGFVANRLLGWLHTGPSYVGAWYSRSYDDYQGRYRRYATIVHYKYSDFTSPTDVAYWPVD
ncbi:hypothetical protein ACFDTO_13205 [Microbacteriaceae bacterium 4G12]